MKTNVLIAADDRRLADDLAQQLRLHEEIATDTAFSGQDALDLIRDRYFDALILDADLPGIGGREICRVIRREGFLRPIIVLTAIGSEAEQVLAMEAGATDHLAKPFNTTVLLAKLRSHLRQHELTENAVCLVGPYTFAPADKLLINEDGKRISLTATETRLLRYLYRTRGRAVSHKQLLRDVWSYASDAESHTVEVHMFRLRQKLDWGGGNGSLIVSGKDGYRLVSEG